jgi:dienelactone hydrolase
MITSTIYQPIILYRRFRSIVPMAVAALILAHSAQGEAPRALPKGQLPDDVRLQSLKDLDGYFPFKPSRTTQQWSERADRVRRQMLVALGLWPMPAKTALNPVVHGKVEREDYTVEKVYFESVPGFFVTGSLYRPKGKTGPLPAVLCPHGHWADGRFHDAGLNNVRKEIAQGAERFEEGGRSPLQARCVQLARMGCVVFHYDMIGYADSEQLSYELAHRFAKQRPEMSTTENWGLFSPQAEANLQTVMGLQTWNSIRALDFILDLPEVDSTRIAVTGASGGGTQTFVLAGLDPRVTVAFPAVMVSTAMQGGCTCENASLLRVGTGNIEFAALFAPKPMGMTSADDWTREMSSKGFPELVQHYKMFGATNNLMLKRGEHFGHNYNHVSRTALYGWINKHFKLGFPEPVLERDYKRLSKDEMTVWDAQHPKPESGPGFERKLLRWLTDDANQQLRQIATSAEQYQRIAGAAFDSIIGRSLGDAGEVEWELKQKNDKGNHIEMTGLLRNRTYNELLPATFLYPKEWKGHTVIWVSQAGKAGLFSNDKAAPQPISEVQQLLDAGATVVGLDLLYQGEFLPDGTPVTKTRRVKNTREFAGYTFGYNPTLFAQRTHDILSLVKYITGHEQKTTRLDIVGLDGSGALVAAARAQARGAIHRAALNTEQFRFANVRDLQDVNFLPGGAKYGDLPGLLALAAPQPTYVIGEGEHLPEAVSKMYQLANGEKNLASAKENNPKTRAAVIQWLNAK